MKTLTLFYLTDCPYCHNAKRALEELYREEPAFAGIQIDWVEEREQPDVAARYDYYYVPTVFDGTVKRYEARPGESYADCKAQLRAVLTQALG